MKLTVVAPDLSIVYNVSCFQIVKETIFEVTRVLESVRKILVVCEEKLKGDGSITIEGLLGTENKVLANFIQSNPIGFSQVNKALDLVAGSPDVPGLIDDEKVPEELKLFFCGKEISAENKWFEKFGTNHKTKARVFLCKDTEEQSEIKSVGFEEQIKDLRIKFPSVFKLLSQEAGEVKSVGKKRIHNSTGNDNVTIKKRCFEENPNGWSIKSGVLDNLLKARDVKKHLKLDALREDLAKVYNAESPERALKALLPRNASFREFVDVCLQNIGALDSNGQFDSANVINTPSRKEHLQKVAVLDK